MNTIVLKILIALGIIQPLDLPILPVPVILEGAENGQGS